MSKTMYSTITHCGVPEKALWKPEIRVVKPFVSQTLTKKQIKRWRYDLWFWLNHKLYKFLCGFMKIVFKHLSLYYWQSWQEIIIFMEEFWINEFFKA